MKFAAYLLLTGAVSAQSFFQEAQDANDAALSEMIDITISRQGEQRLQNKTRALDGLIREIQRGPDRETQQKMKRKFEELMDKYGPVYESRYKEAINHWMISPEYQDAQDFEMNTLPNSPEGKKLIGDAKRLVADTVGLREFVPTPPSRRNPYGGSWEYLRPIYQGDSERIRDPEDPENWRKGSSWSHLENSDVKDIAEDILGVRDDFRGVFGNADLMRQWREKDMGAFNEMHFQEILQKASEDTGIESWSELGDVIGDGIREYGPKIKRALKRCPKVQRLRKLIERIARTAVGSVSNLGDLPTGRRQAWVNDLGRRLMALKTGADNGNDPIPQARQMIRDAVRELVHELDRAAKGYAGHPM